MTHPDLVATADDKPSIGASATTALHYLAALIMTVFASAIAIGIDSTIAIPNLSMVYMVPVVIAGAAFGTGPSLFAAVLGALSYNYFLTAPRYTLTVDDPANIWAITLLLLVGLIVSGVAFVSGRKASEASELRRQATILQRLSGAITGADGARAAASLAVDALAALFDAPAAVMMVRGGALETIAQSGAAELSQAERDAAMAAITGDLAVRGGVYPDDRSRFDFWPVGTVAVIGVALPGDERPPLPEASVDVVRGLLALAMARQAPQRGAAG